jgi:hypothetical protein
MICRIHIREKFAENLFLSRFVSEMPSGLHDIGRRERRFVEQTVMYLMFSRLWLVCNEQISDNYSPIVSADN